MTSETPPLREGDAANTPKISGAVSPEASAPPKSQGGATPSPSALATTRAAAAWFATAVALVLLVLLIVLILQNQDVVKLHYWASPDPCRWGRRCSSRQSPVLPWSQSWASSGSRSCASPPAGYDACKRSTRTSPDQRRLT